MENRGTLKYVTDCYENREMCDKAFDNYPHELEFVPECYKCVLKVSVLNLLQ